MSFTTQLDKNKHNYNGWLTGISRGVLAAILLLPLSLLLSGCFTGIESTPKITYKDVKKQQAGETPEQVFSRSFRSVPFNDWQPGRRFLAGEGRLELSYSPQPGKPAVLSRGDTLCYRGIREVKGITGRMDAEMIFTVGKSLTDTVIYRPGTDVATLRERENIKLPFLVDLDLIEDASHYLLDKELYTRTDRWTVETPVDTAPRKFLKVKITGVTAGNEDYPYLIRFISLEPGGETGSTLMSVNVDDGSPALRGFENLFMMNNPRDSYPHISNEKWLLIREGKVAVGMTGQEVMLSLGMPRDIDRRHNQSMSYERWIYTGGVYIVFEDGVVTSFNQ